MSNYEEEQFHAVYFFAARVVDWSHIHAIAEFRRVALLPDPLRTNFLGA
jgi:hypothetical protein